MLAVHESEPTEGQKIWRGARYFDIAGLTSKSAQIRGSNYTSCPLVPTALLIIDEFQN